MRNFDKRIATGLAIIGALCLLWLIAAGGLVWLSLTPNDRTTVLTTLGPRLIIIATLWAGSLIAMGFALHTLIRRYLTAPARLHEDAQVLLGTSVKRRLIPQGSPENRKLTALINQLVDQREALREEMDSRIQEAAQNTELEKNRLAALMSELTMSVIVCNLDGRILLYNNRARLQFKALSRSPGISGGVESIGLGRSIYSAFDPAQLAHALEDIQHRFQRGAAHPSSQFVTATPSGTLLRVHLAPVRSVRKQADNKVKLRGFIMLTENITQEFTAQSRQDRAIHDLTEISRSTVANLQTALDALDYPDIEPALQRQLLSVLREETSKLGDHLTVLTDSNTDDMLSRWPLEDMLGSEYIEAAERRIQTLADNIEIETEIDQRLWLRVESFSLLQAMTYLASRIFETDPVRALKITLTQHDNRAQLALSWSPTQPLDNSSPASWEHEPMHFGDESFAMTIAQVLERHNGSCWFEHDEPSSQLSFRFLVPLANPQEQLESVNVSFADSRPEYYDFDLFQSNQQAQTLEDALLTDLTYTIFDTETTGLNPAQGDEIIQIGAVRMLNGKLLPHESFDQLVDPKRNIPKETIPIHGIEPAMVLGKPTIEEVLPAFHRFAQDTILVAHNAAFDMRCLQVKEQATGCIFDNLVLDTLLLSAVVHPNQQSHKLEAIAERFNVNILGRHTALGDAMATAEVFRHLVPLLAEQGIQTLGQAREASQKTYFARLKY